ncbi:MAG: DUF1566 domain-containing protein [Ignavibacteria bacterium]|nr:DUF1566 domain-containing protein [Ignavibacteria bacterium]
MHRGQSLITVPALFFAGLLSMLLTATPNARAQQYRITGTGVAVCFDNRTTISCPTAPGAPFYGQFQGSVAPSFRNNGDGTVSDLNTGLMWQRDPDANGNGDGRMERIDKLTWPQIQARVAALNSTRYAGYGDWRIPSIKELYSLTNWNGTDPAVQGTSTAGLRPFIDTAYFPFAWGQTTAGERIIDAQYASGSMYKDLSFAGHQQLFGFNFADGRIKGYDLKMPGGADKTFSFIAVRGNGAYGINDFGDNADMTITDRATGLMWMKDDSRTGMNWEAALAWAQAKNVENFLGHNDWRLPNAKELQSIVDYTRSPGSSASAAIDPIFLCTSITNEAGRADWPWYWTSTTHQSFNGTAYGAAAAVYVCFGTAPGWVRIMPNSFYSYVDVHGAGAQRSSPKAGTNLGDPIGVDSAGNTVYGRGPQGDLLRIDNFVRLVRDAGTTGVGDEHSDTSPKVDQVTLLENTPNPFAARTEIRFRLARPAAVDLRVYDVFGREVAVLLSEEKPAGVHAAQWTAEGFPRGVYFYSLKSGVLTRTRRMLLSR